MKTFSVIVPVYKAAHTVERCVDSIISSGGEDVEVILIEDCSPDNSWEVCQQLAAKYPNVVAWRNESNRGVSYTRNQGVNLSKGLYLLFADSDDWVDKCYIPAFRQAIQEGHSFAICGYVNHDEKHSGRTDCYGWEGFDLQSCPLGQHLQELHDQLLLKQLWNKIFVTEIVKKHHIRFDESISIGEDFRFILDYIQLSEIKRVCLINRHLYHYMRDQDGSLMYRVGYEGIDGALLNLRKFYTLQGIDNIEQRLTEDRKTKLQSFAYLIMHNVGMPLVEKKRLILALDSTEGKELYLKHRLLFIKERIKRKLSGR